MTFVLLLVLIGIALLFSSLRSRARHAGPGTYRLLLGPALIVLGVVTLPFVMLSRMLFAVGFAVLLIGALGTAINRSK